ncbi:MAG: threo-3-hydroxy-L-aspartate ammonia-lyase [Armatimonadetes bacterium]|nr:threo-3-hydroxy-L-aspartate ammonia-lyase [Armatimonadota bacterium]
MRGVYRPEHNTLVPVTFRDIEDAAARLEGITNRTPIHTSRTLDLAWGATVFVKCECFQRAGAFKFRGAYNALSRLTPEQRSHGVLTFSSGNHAQALALAGRLLGVEVTIVMPRDAPFVKRLATESYGGQIVLYDRDETSREALGKSLAEEKGLTIVPPYDHPDIVAGQGTVVRELIQEVGPLDLLFVPCGGGGLLSGSALAADHLSPDCRVVGCEPAAADDAARSFETRTLQRIENPETIADGARTPSLGDLTFQIVMEHVDAFERVTDEELLSATRFFWERMKLLVEPTGALGLAGAKNHGSFQGKRIGVVVSGGNCDVAELGPLLKKSARFV